MDRRSRGYPARKDGLQHFENHDHERFVYNFGIIRRDANDRFNDGDRSLRSRVQPHLIALLTAKGIPMLRQGREFGSNAVVPESGFGRVMMFRPGRWDFYYDEVGGSVIKTGPVAAPHPAQRRAVPVRRWRVSGAA